VVSADIIEYGMPPENHEPIEQSAKLLPTDNSAPNEITNNKTTPTEYSIGESVIYTNSKNSYDARIIGFGEYNFSDRVKIEYINESGTTKKRWAYMEMISKK
jgi:hypothetical protein